MRAWERLKCEMWLSTVYHVGRTRPQGASERHCVTDVWRGLALKGRPVCVTSVIKFILYTYCHHIVCIVAINSIIYIHFCSKFRGESPLDILTIHTVSNRIFFDIKHLQPQLFFSLNNMKPSWMWALNVTWIKYLWCTLFNLPMQLTEEWIFKTQFVLCMRIKLNCLFSTWELLARKFTALMVYLSSLLPPTFNILNANRVFLFPPPPVCWYTIVLPRYMELTRWLCSLAAQLGLYTETSTLGALHHHLWQICRCGGKDLKRTREKYSVWSLVAHLNPHVWVQRFLFV